MTKPRARKSKKQADEIEKSVNAEPEVIDTTPRRRDLLSSGSTLLNLASTDNAFGAFLKGKYYLIVGDSTSGKTFLSMTCFAEACINRQFKDYRLIYDNIEDGMLMDVDELFGEEVAKRIEPPAMEEGEPLFSYTIEDFYYNIDDAAKKEKPFLYILDSMDALSSEAEGEKFTKNKKEHRLGKKKTGSYGDGKAKKNSAGIRTLLKGLRDTGSILIILSQTRDDLGFGYNEKSRSGGKALRFYATLEIWSSVIETIEKTVNGIKRAIGNKVLIKNKKNRITGKKREIEIDIYPSYGMDDLSSCIDYLLMEGFWKLKKTKIDATHFKQLCTREKLIDHIEKNGLENQLRSITGKCWKKMEDSLHLKRKRKYDVGSD